MTKKTLLEEKLKVINMGIETFASALKNQGVSVIIVDWKPPAGGDKEMLKLLEKLGV